MKAKSKIRTVLFVCFASIIVLEACQKDDDTPMAPAKPVTDIELYQMSNTTNGFVWYKYSDTLLVKSSGSGHQPPFLRTRFNATAASKLDNAGKIIPGATFPEGSLIVKELRNDLTTLVRYAVMYKQTGNVNADANGWLWTYINPDGSSAIPISDKGAQCINCHSQSGNINGVLMNKYFP